MSQNFLKLLGFTLILSSYIVSLIAIYTLLA